MELRPLAVDSGIWTVDLHPCTLGLGTCAFDVNPQAFVSILLALGSDASAIGLRLRNIGSGASAFDVESQSDRLGAFAVHLNSLGMQVAHALLS